MVEQAIQMALQPSAIYHKMQRVFSMYENSTLKGQKVRVMSGITLQKAFEGKLAPKLPQFQVFQGLQVFKMRVHQYCTLLFIYQVLGYLSTNEG